MIQPQRGERRVLTRTVFSPWALSLGPEQQLAIKMEQAVLKSKREDVCPGKKLDLATVQQQLAETKGPEYWRSLEELAGSPEFQQMLHREFPKGASEKVG